MYLGVVNVNVQERTIGSVDVWHCGACKKQFCEEKQLGIEAIAEQVGMPRIGPDERWAVVVCRLQKGRDRWRLVRMKEGAPVGHECVGEKAVSLPARGFAVDEGEGGVHWSFLVDDHVNEAVEI